MYSFLTRILDKPLRAIVDGCQNMYDVTKVNPQPPKKPQHGIMREPVTSDMQDRKHHYQVDENVYHCNRIATQKNKIATELNGPYRKTQRLSSEPNRVSFAMEDNLSDSWIGVRKVQPTNEPLPSKAQEYSDTHEDPEVVDPRNHYKHLILRMGFYFPETQKPEVDGFILVSDNDDDEDDDYA